ncbi:MAG: hypothetical protein KAS78_06210, partial [Candidatus Pacebacteria bacterium]|nr:hypothetical protein [Candidatus Paceibacterota bacterium]
SVFEITNIAENEATINLSNVQNASQVAVSTTPDFKYTSWELYEKNKTIDISNANKLYIKFRSKTGGVSKVIEVEINKDLEPKKIPNGSLIKVENDHKVYIKKGSYLRHIPNPAIFSFYNHFKWDDIKIITKEKFNQYQTSTLIRELNDTKVYQINDNDLAKHHLNITAEQFTDSGRSWEMVYVVNKRERDYYEMGEDVEE